MRRPLLAGLLVAASLAAAGAQDTPPQDGAPQTARPPAEGLPQPEDVPVPEDRPEPPAAAAAGEAPTSAPEDEAAASPAPPDAPPGEARTTPEPGAPDVPPSAVTPAEAVEAAAAIEDARLCEAELTARGAEFTVGPSISDGDCGVLRPVRLTRLSSGAKLSPDTEFLCRTALALDIWVAEGVVPAASEAFEGAALETLRHASTYVCRSRSGEARISEHSRGSAVDIAGFDLSGARSVEVVAQTPGTPEAAFLAAVRRAACGPFRTVLGPGTDADHATHFHFDIAARQNDSTYCR